MKKIALVFFGMVLVVLSSYAGGNKATGATTGTSAAPTTNPVSDTPVTFTLAWGGEYSPNFKIWEAMRRMTNVSLDVDAAPDADFDNTKREVVLASGNMPDIVTRTAGSGSINELGMNGKLLPINKYFDRLPNFTALVEKNGWQDMIKDLTAPDGNMYQLPMAITEIQLNYKQQIFRTDLLAKHNLKMPTTWDEMYEVCKVLKREYPDSYPMQIIYGIGNLLDMMAPAWGTAGGWGSGRNNFFYEESTGKWIYAPTSDNFKAMLQYLSKCYAEGLLEREFTTLDGNLYSEKASTNKAFFLIADWMGGEVEKQNALREAGFTDAVWEPIWPLAGPTGKPTVARTGWFTQGCVFNAKLANDPRFDAFLRWVNWLFSDEGIYLINYGVEGETYTRDANRKVVYKPEIKTAMNPKGTVELSSTWGIGWPAFQFVLLADTNLAPGQYNEAYVDLMVREAEAGCYAKKVPTLALLPDDLEEERIVAVALNDYVSQMLEKFIMGGESFNNWNTFVAQCKQKGSDRLQTLYTKVWARQNSGK